MAPPNLTRTDAARRAALLKVAGISDDTERGEAYLREKSAVRHGYRWLNEDDK